jgi:hypothetical protein
MPATLQCIGDILAQSTWTRPRIDIAANRPRCSVAVMDGSEQKSLPVLIPFAAQKEREPVFEGYLVRSPRRADAKTPGQKTSGDLIPFERRARVLSLSFAFLWRSHGVTGARSGVGIMACSRDCPSSHRHKHLSACILARELMRAASRTEKTNERNGDARGDEYRHGVGGKRSCRFVLIDAQAL